MTYKKLREIGQGGFGRVYEVADDAGCRFALKEFEPGQDIKIAIGRGQLTLENLKGRFKREVKYQSQIKSRNITRIIEHDLDADQPWFVMELAEGTLQDDLRNDRSLGGDPTRALFDILAGLDDIHKRGIVHRDLKPVNVLRLRNDDGSVRYAISDFGLISAVASDTTTLTQTGHGGGTALYAAPELITRFKYATLAADIYSFGAILHDIFDGGPRTPYLEITTTGSCREVIEKCTKTNVGRRYSDVAGIRADLYQTLVGQTLVFNSDAEQEVIELLSNKEDLIDTEWDRVFTQVSREDANENSKRQLFGALSITHLRALADSSAELFNAVGFEFSKYVREFSHNFDYCDVLADKMDVLFELSSTALKAHCLITLLIMGVDHNRFFVERKFLRHASPQLDLNVAERMRMDIVAESMPWTAYLERFESSISASRTELHPLVWQDLA